MPPTPLTKSLTRQFVPFLGRDRLFRHRDDMKRASLRQAHLPMATPLITVLPVDSTGNHTASFPMDANDQYGDCGPAMMAHLFGVLTFGQGKPGYTEWLANQNALVQQYLQVSGGDNGTDESMLVGPGGIAITGLAGDQTAVVVDSLDFDVTNIPLTQYLIDQFYSVQMAWSVPNAFIRSFHTGAQFFGPMNPNPANGHYTPLMDVDANGHYTLPTWGSYCFVDAPMVASVQPQCFVALSPRQFNAAGYDSKGRHVTTQAAAWIALGGNAQIANALAATFPAPTNVPTPVVTPPSPTPAPAPVSDSFLIYNITQGIISYPSSTIVAAPTVPGRATNPTAIDLAAILQLLMTYLPVILQLFKTKPGATPINWAQILAIILQILEGLNPPAPAPASLKRSAGSPPFNPTPATLDDVLSNNDLLVALQASIEADGINDPGVTLAFTNLINSNLEGGFSSLAAYATANLLDAPPVVTHLGETYAATTTGELIVLDPDIPASSVPYVAPAAPVTS